MGSWHRRMGALQLLPLLLWLTLLLATPVRADSIRLVALDWATAETAQALGVIPVGMAQLADYHIWSGDMPMPATVVDVGLRMEPNLELIRALRPDLIVISPMQQGALPLLQRIAPVQVLAFNSPEQPDSYQQARRATRQLAQWLGREAQGEALLVASTQALQQLRQRVQGDGQVVRPIYLLRFADRRHGWVLGANSLFGGGLAAVGIPLAWQQATNLWGFASVPLTALMAEPEALVVYIAPLPFADMSALQGNQLWQSLPAVRSGRVVGLPPVWLGNGLPSLIYFSRLLADHWPQRAGDEPLPRSLPYVSVH
jgi:ferric hydroxamate transport system substrate-binding protein